MTADAAVSVREESAADHDRVRWIHHAAFGRRGEAALVDRLRADGRVAASLVAERPAGHVHGHILFPLLLCAPKRVTAAALAPVAVDPGQQNAGIGSALVRAGLIRCREIGIDIVVVLGDPDFYRRFGFQARTAKELVSSFHGPAFGAVVLSDRVAPQPRLALEWPDAFLDV